MPGKPWSTEELDRIRAAKDVPTTVLARAMGRSASAVYQARWNMGFVRSRCPLGEAFEAFALERHGRGWSDAEIAAAWSRRWPDRRPMDRHTVAALRHRHGLADNALSVHRRQRVRERTAEQLRKAGLSSLGAVRARAFMDYARAAGWPADLRPRQVQMLDALWRLGPLTRRQIADEIKMPWKGSRKSLVGNVPGGSYLADLIARGLVAAAKRANTVTGKGRGWSTDLYLLTPLAVQTRAAGKDENHVEQQSQREQQRQDQRLDPASGADAATGRGDAAMDAADVGSGQRRSDRRPDQEDRRKTDREGRGRRREGDAVPV